MFTHVLVLRYNTELSKIKMRIIEMEYMGDFLKDYQILDFYAHLA